MNSPRPGPSQCDQREVWTSPSPRGMVALVFGTGLLIALGGGTHPFSLGLLALVLGLAMALTRSTAVPIGKGPGLCWCALIAWILLALCWPATAVDWRLEAETLGLPVGTSLSPQPWVTLEALLGFLAGSAFFLLAQAFVPDSGARRHAMHWLAVVLVLLGAGAILAGYQGWRLPWADQVHVFSWFPNRNQTALTFACGSVLCFGLALMPRAQLRRKSRGAPFAPKHVAPVFDLASSSAFIGGVLLLYALFQSLSRGALLAWSCGMLVLLLFRAREKSHNRTVLLRFAPALALLLFSFFVFAGGASRDRMIDAITGHTLHAEDDPLTTDFRWQIYTDTVAMIADHPVTGIGLGQFHYIFPHYRSLPAPPVSILHPESDWLWWWSELGFVGVALIILGLTFLLLRLRSPIVSSHDSLLCSEAIRDRNYRHAAMAALVPFFIHSLVDVGAHRLGTVALAICLYTLALPQTQILLRPRARTRKLWRAGGLTLVLLGSGLAVLAARKSPSLTAYAPSAQEPLTSAPLQWQPYFRAALQTFSNDPDMAVRHFQRARFLQADNAEIPYVEGLFLLNRQRDDAAFEAFHSAITRSHEPTELFRQILRRTATQASLQVRLYRLAQSDNALLATYWSALPGTMLEDPHRLDQLYSDWPNLPPALRGTILNQLQRRSLIQPLLELFQSSPPAIQREIWPQAMRAQVAAGQHEEALALFNQWVAHKPLPEVPVAEEKLRTLQANALMHPDDPAASLRLLQAYLSRKMWEDTRRIAERICETPEPPRDTHYWLGRALSETGHSREAARAYAEWLAP